MAKKHEPKNRITFVESELGAADLARLMPDTNFSEFELFVRAPDKFDDKEFSVAARLCSCRKICIAVVEQ